MPRLRALLIAVAILGYGLAGAPVPRSASQRQVFSAEGRDELARWVELLGGLGYTTTPRALGEAVIRLSRPITEARHAALAPLKPWLRLTGTGQRWGLFAYPDTRPQRLFVECRREAGWEPLFVAGEAEHDWAAARLHHRRLRGVWDGVSGRRRPGLVYEDFVALVAAWAFEERPGCTAVRVGVERLHAAAPGEPTDPPQRIHVRVVRAP